ncbi:hypothetical protein GO009_07705 [Muricauda sp. TY007]|uniref:DUF6520 family protein n=1 Tax=Allomuricauda sp. TY007 TaxID=2683200 RepID=UPI0013BFEE07|nr:MULTISPECIES: DUF6520 family protein [unclassified Allomuricauda]MBA4744686.1 hypothetical protein [Allomuricauda sp.]NDV15906.1 hypothetical protein [Muricauda sp. TY007]
MRKNLFKTIMPAIAIVFAVAAAFATQAKDENGSALVDAYIPMGPGQPCENTGLKCETTVLPNICTYQGQQAFGLEGLTSCSVDLYRD